MPFLIQPGTPLASLPYNDKSVFECISQGKCAGIFQLESGGMKNFMKELKPDCLEDLIAGISLYRPGPMDFIPQYIKGKENAGAFQEPVQQRTETAVQAVPQKKKKVNIEKGENSALWFLRL